MWVTYSLWSLFHLNCNTINRQTLHLRWVLWPVFWRSEGSISDLHFLALANGNPNCAVSCTSGLLVEMPQRFCAWQWVEGMWTVMGGTEWNRQNHGYVIGGMVWHWQFAPETLLSEASWCKGEETHWQGRGLWGVIFPKLTNRVLFSSIACKMCHF